MQVDIDSRLVDLADEARSGASTTLHAGLGSLDRRSPRALHEQLSDRIREVALNDAGFLGPLPPEPDLAVRFDVSRQTVRRAIQTLVDEGLLLRRQGKGTFIASRPPKIIHSLDRLAPFIETIERAGYDLDTQMLDWGWIQGADVPAILGGPDASALQIRRLYFVGGVPHAVANISVAGRIGQRLSRRDTERPPIFAALRKAGVELGRAEITISCRTPDQRLASELGVSSTTPVLLLRRVTYSTIGEPVELTDHYLRSDVYMLTVTVDAEGGHRSDRTPGGA